MTRTDKRIATLAVAAILLLAYAASGLAQSAAPPPTAPRYVDHHRCGVADVTVRQPLTEVSGDVDGDGRVEHYAANAGGVERFRVQPGSVPPTKVLDGVVYRSSTTPQYACVDLRLVDLDRDGRLDLVFASPTELVVMTNRGGRLEVTRRETLSYSATARIRITVAGSSVTAVPL